MQEHNIGDILEYQDGTFDLNLEEAKAWVHAHDAVLEEILENRRTDASGNLFRYFIIRIKNNGELQAEVRSIRNQLLRESDWTQLADAPLTAEQKEAWRTYRQALRNVPEQSSFPDTVVWPVLEN